VHFAVGNGHTSRVAAILTSFTGAIPIPTMSLPLSCSIAAIRVNLARRMERPATVTVVNH
jgi:hypothetical protein